MASLGYGQPAQSERNSDAEPSAETRDNKSLVQEARERVELHGSAASLQLLLPPDTGDTTGSGSTVRG